MESQYGNYSPDNNFYEPQPVTPEIPPELPGERKYGLGKAIASLITSIVSVFFIVFSMIFIAFLAVALEEDLGAPIEEFISLGIAFAILSLPLIVLGIVFGIAAIKCFFEKKKAHRPKPVATLILGIIGLGTSVESAFVFLSVIFQMMLIANMY